MYRHVPARKSGDLDVCSGTHCLNAWGTQLGTHCASKNLALECVVLSFLKIEPTCTHKLRPHAPVPLLVSLAAIKEMAPQVIQFGQHVLLAVPGGPT